MLDKDVMHSECVSCVLYEEKLGYLFKIIAKLYIFCEVVRQVCTQ
jgi:hypothetical protein